MSLTHWGWDKIAAILQMTFSNEFSCMKIFIFSIEFHWSLFLRFQLTTSHHWFRQWLGAASATSHYLNQWCPVHWCIYICHPASMHLVVTEMTTNTFFFCVCVFSTLKIFLVICYFYFLSDQNIQDGCYKQCSNLSRNRCWSSNKTLSSSTKSKPNAGIPAGS